MTKYVYPEKKEEGIRCPRCGSDSHVYTTIPKARKIIRYRRCKKADCLFNFATIESL